jgi:hypothetical protein
VQETETFVTHQLSVFARLLLHAGVYFHEFLARATQHEMNTTHQDLFPFFIDLWIARVPTMQVHAPS